MTTYDLWVDDDEITADRLNNLERTSLIVCTSTTRPTDPTAGMTIFETDTWKKLQYTTATVGWVPPWYDAWGNRGYGIDNLEHDSIGTSGYVVLGTGAFDSPAGRVLQIHFNTCFVAYDAPSSGAVRFKITRYKDGDGGTDVQVASWAVNGEEVEEFRMATGMEFDVLTEAGNYVYALIAFTVDSTVMTIRGDITESKLMVIDVGPNGAPAA